MKNERAPAASFDPAGRIAGLLGMARRAGKLTAGFDAVAALIGRGKAAAVMTAADLSEKTNKELRFAAQDRPGLFLPLPLRKEEIGAALGLKKPVGVLALEDEGFAASLRKLAGQEDGPCQGRTSRKDDRRL